jgi:cytochrome c553
VMLLVLMRARRKSIAPEPYGPITGPLVRTMVKHPWLTVGVLVVFGISGALIVVSLGVIPIKASSGHWRITEASLDFAKVRSVSTYSLAIRVPQPLDDPALVLRGAGHHENGCYPCHGRPGTPMPPTTSPMTPSPPPLPALVRRWKPEELFWIVKHGIKFTGMPAWPAQQRDDEVWAIVAFLGRMPTLDAETYRSLVYGRSDATYPAQDAPPHAVRGLCWRCHGEDGAGRGPGAFPALAGQRSTYIYESLRAFADRRRFSGIMRTVAANLDDRTMREVAAYYERLPPRSADRATDAAALERGESIAVQGIHERDIPSCSDCHGPGGAPKNPAYPVLANQHHRYLALQLELFQQGRRGGSGFANLMHVFVGRLGPEEINDVTLYYSSCPECPP